MKKIISILATIALCGTTSINLVACGSEDPSTQKINLSDLPTYVKINTTATVDDYKHTLITKLKKEKEFNNLLETDVDITQENGSALPTNITTDILATKITAKKQNNKFIDSKTIAVIITKVIDLSDLPTDVKINTTATVDDYKYALITKLEKEKEFNNLLETDVDITKSDGTVLGIELKNSDITTGNLKTKVTAKKQNNKFTNSTIITVTITAATEVINFWEDFRSLAFNNNNELYAGTNNKWIYKINQSSGTGTATPIIYLGGNVEALAFNSKNEFYAGASDQKIYQIDLTSDTKTEIADLGASVQSLAFNNKDELYAGANNNWIYKIDIVSGKKTPVIDLEVDVEALAFNSKNEFYAGTRYGWIYQINITVPSATVITSLEANVEALAFNNKDQLYAGASDDSIYQVDQSSVTEAPTSVIYISSSLEALAFNNKDELYAGASSEIYKIKT